MFRFLSIFALLFVAHVGQSETSWAGKISHVIVLMMENRSFDHMLGFLKEQRPEVDGCLPSMGEMCTNPIDPHDPSSRKIPVGDHAVYIQPADPDHSVVGTSFQIYSNDNPSQTKDKPTMKGFVKQYAHKDKEHPNGTFIMECFESEAVPIITSLANNFGLFDRWFCDVPGPTEPNRMYTYLGTSAGMGSDDKAYLARGFPGIRSIFEMLDRETTRKNEWRVYFQQITTALFVDYVRLHPERLHNIEDFYRHVKKGDLPTYTWLDPRYYDLIGFPAADQHPDHDVTLGEKLFKNVYEAVRNGPKWNETLFIITYDEHGGFFDHVPPPAAKKPDGINTTDINPQFDFSRFGVRIPTIMISPWIPKGFMGLRPDPSDAQYSGASIVETVRKMFAPTQKTLTNRTAAARTFEDVISLSAPRTDCPTKLPPVPHNKSRVHESLRRPGGKEGELWWTPGYQYISDFQQSLIHVAGHLCNATEVEMKQLANQDEAGRWVVQCVNKFLGREVASF